MSTISTHLNWGASYVVHDFYSRFIDPNASEKKLVALGRWTISLLMVAAGLFALVLDNALQAFSILLQIGAGTGLLFILRWFWYRINVFSEITAMVVSFVLAIYMQVLHPLLGFTPLSTFDQLLIGVGITTLAWIGVTLVTTPEDEATLIRFYEKIQPGGPGWKKVIAKINAQQKTKAPAPAWDVPLGIVCMIMGTLAVYSVLFALGSLLYGDYIRMAWLGGLAAISLWGLFYFWRKMSRNA
jgi:SSS family solute:Na+ symporter